jgi:hypothetical protein
MGNDGSTECLNFLLEARANRKAPKDVRFTPLPLVNTKCVFSSIFYILFFLFSCRILESQCELVYKMYLTLIFLITYAMI